jgi:hypothetical protein
MQRRKFIAAMGSLAAGGAAATGTGAFTSVQAQRAVDVAVATDNDAYLALKPTGDRATTDSDNQLKLDLESSNNGSSGLNPDARTAFTDIFEIRNQGDNDVLVAVGLSQENIYENGSSQGNAEPHLFDTSGVSGFVYDEDPASGTGSGLGPNADNFQIRIDSGGRVDLSKKFETATFADDDRLVKPGETVEVDLSVITQDEINSGNGIPDSNKQITVMAVEPGSDREEDS